MRVTGIRSDNTYEDGGALVVCRGVKGRRSKEGISPCLRTCKFTGAGQCCACGGPIGESIDGLDASQQGDRARPAHDGVVTSSYHNGIVTGATHYGVVAVAHANEGSFLAAGVLWRGQSCTQRFYRIGINVVVAIASNYDVLAATTG